MPAFNALREFEWIGYPEMRADIVQEVLASHSHIQSLGLIGWHFDAVGVVSTSFPRARSDDLISLPSVRIPQLAQIYITC